MTHLSILKAAVVAKLQEAPAVCSLIEQEALGVWSQTVSQALVVRDDGTTASQTSFGLAGVAAWTSTLVIDCYVRATSNANRLTALDALLDAVYTRLMADPTLSGTLRGLVPRQITAADSVLLGDQTTSRSLVFNGLHSAGATL